MHVGQQVLGGLGQDPPDRPSFEKGVAACDLPGHELPGRGDLRAGVSRADHDERAACGAFGGVVAGGGQIELAQDVIAQVEGIGDVVEAEAVRRDLRDRPDFGDAADGDDEPVVVEPARDVVGVDVVNAPAGGVDAVDGAEDDAHIAQRSERYRDPARLEVPRGHVGQQGQAEREVGRVHQHHLRSVPHTARQSGGGVVAGEPGSDDHDTWRPHGVSAQDRAVDHVARVTGPLDRTRPRERLTPGGPRAVLAAGQETLALTRPSWLAVHAACSRTGEKGGWRHVLSTWARSGSRSPGRIGWIRGFTSKTSREDGM